MSAMFEPHVDYVGPPHTRHLADDPVAAKWRATLSNALSRAGVQSITERVRIVKQGVFVSYETSAGDFGATVGHDGSLTLSDVPENILVMLVERAS